LQSLGWDADADSLSSENISMTAVHLLRFHLSTRQPRSNLSPRVSQGCRETFEPRRSRTTRSCTTSQTHCSSEQEAVGGSTHGSGGGYPSRFSGIGPVYGRAEAV
jgi:hypothetical protein